MADNAGSKVSFFLVGLGIGALVGILFAPKSGEETREYLSLKADEGREYAQRKARELRERAEDLVERSKQAARRKLFPRRWMRAAMPTRGRKPKRSNRAGASAWKAGCHTSWL
jgi:gas vesicle protein